MSPRILFAQDCINCKSSKEIAVAAREVKLVEDLSSTYSQTVHIDHDFITKVENKAFNYVRPKVNDGEPNCVATALRAGKYVPAFALNGTDSFYEGILPYCFSKQEEGSQIGGDLGIFYYKKDNFHTLAHMFLFLDDKNVFEKPGPKNEHLFQKNTLNELKKKNIDEEMTLEIWRFNPKKNCPLITINKEFGSLPENSLLKRVSREIEERISSADWASPASTFTKKELEEFLLERKKKIKNWFSRLPGGYRAERDYPKLLELEYPLDIIKTAQRIPITK